MANKKMNNITIVLPKYSKKTLMPITSWKLAGILQDLADATGIYVGQNDLHHFVSRWHILRELNKISFEMTTVAPWD